MLWTRRWQSSLQLSSQRCVAKTGLISKTHLCGRRRLGKNFHLRHGVDQLRIQPFRLGHLPYSTTTTLADKKLRQFEVREYLSSNLGDEKQEIFQKLRSGDTHKTWMVVEEPKTPDDTSLQQQVMALPKKTASLLLPEHYPHSVAKGYLPFVSFCFVSSIAGSAAMVLSTQTLLLAVGIVSGGQSSAAVMAGALNWVLKDFMGQLGGIIFASRMGKTKAFDNDPKRWRMVAATALDGATLLEILSPLCHSHLVLPIASIANIGKNIGFLTASASRASLHQSLAISGNLGDVTVKAGSQSMVASLAGTSLGIGLSTILQHDVWNFGICFVGLSIIHQGCTYRSLQHVPVAHFNRHRLHLAMEYLIQNEKTPSPVDIAEKESFVPIFSSDASTEWLRIGRPVRQVFKTPTELEECLTMIPNKSYLVHFDESTQKVDLIYFHTANERDICRGMYHACLIRHKATKQKNADSDKSAYPEMRREQKDALENITRETHKQVEQNFSNLFEGLQAKGWDISSGVTDVEDVNSHRINIKILKK